MTPADLLRTLESQSHAQRVRAMINLGRLRDAAIHAAIAELERSGFYERARPL